MEEDDDDDDDEILCSNSDKLYTGMIFQIPKKNSYSTQLRIAVLNQAHFYNKYDCARMKCWYIDFGDIPNNMFEIIRTFQ